MGSTKPNRAGVVVSVAEVPFGGDAFRTGIGQQGLDIRGGLGVKHLRYQRRRS